MPRAVCSRLAVVALRVRLLGGLAVDGVDFAALGSRKARRLLARLALGRGRAVAADALVEVLWPDDERAGRPKRTNDQLSVLVSRLRAVLDADRLPRVGGGYALKADWLDVDAQAAFLAEAQKRFRAGSLAPARTAIDAALALSRGPLLPDEPPAEWLDGERAAATRTATTILRANAEIALAADDPWSAVDAAWAALATEPFDEAAVRLLMRALAASGRPAQAIAAYTQTQERLRDELGVDPAPETAQLYVQLLQAPPPSIAVAPARQSLPGRQRELEELDRALAYARSGRAVSVRIAGEGGIGKTRLLDTWAAQQDVAILRAAGSELGGGLPLQPLLDAVAVHMRRHPDVDAGLLAPFLGTSSAHSDGQALTIFADPGSGRAVLFAALDSVMARLAERGPVVLLVDDGHWLDRSSLAWLQHAPRRLADEPLLVVVAYRPGEGSTPPGADTLTLGPLSLADTAEVVGAARAEELHARSGGHPLFLVELAHAGRDELPDTLRAAVAARCDRAGEAAATLRAAAVLGPEVDLDLLSAVLDSSPSALLDHLEEGVRRQLLTESGTRFRFRHHLIREALCAATGASRTALLHRQAARSLHARSGAPAWDVAYHARLGGDLALAADALTTAGEAAARRFDHEEALRFLDEALSIQDTPELRLRRARVALPAGRFEEASADAGAALAGGLGPDGMEVAAIAAYLLRDFRRCRRLAEDGARLADDPALRTSCLALAGRVAHVDGDLDAAADLLHRALDTAPAGVRPLAQLWAAPLRTDRGDPLGALELLGDPVSDLAARHPFVQPHRHLAAGQALGRLGRVDEAMAELALADEAALGQRTGRFAARADNTRAWILRSIGEYAAADDRNEAAYAASVGEPGMTEPVVDALLGLATGRLLAGDPAAALVLVERARAQMAAPYPFSWRHRLLARRLDGECAQAQGDYAGAEAAAAEVASEADRLGIAYPPHL